MSSNPDATETDESTRGILDVKRRPLLQAVGAGATISVGSGIVAAASHDSDSDGDSESGDRESGDAEGAEIDPVFGYPTTDASDVPQHLQPDHEVQLLNAPPSGAERPPFLYFDPVGLHVESGDIVQFTSMSPDHTVTAMHPDIGPPRRVPEDAEPFSSPVQGPGMAWLYRFEHDGVYDLYCAPHLDFGMVMRVVVGELAEADLPEYAESVEGVPNKQAVNESLNMLSEQNENCEWPFVMPAAILDAEAVGAMHIQEAGEVPFAAVVDELGYELPDPEAEPEKGAGATLRVSDHPELGEILVGPDGVTVYMFDQDTQGEAASSCHDDCAEAWPPVTVDADPAAGEGVSADLAAFERESGEMQVTANGWPLYYFAQDAEPGDVTGQGVNGVWWVLRPDGTPVRE